ncbi:uncharacterized protein K452DRAFT_334475 [Aplosporella prunicola CBS 121167]|uniref:RNase H type-1 domain-containing protein n=1 Tax=Aplosporella prunicola CBS 121167 TaxID=1176127 RepID=A0A6A6BA60_9PEZI|nr:uncharacterized protein K452DRAFT_334475 [Aplosporella prunicola CBS 121167]KAF2140960.1 hypothetical protein K452DRAFT_334475 [Aplosporella prunicola CBS 121167]
MAAQGVNTHDSEQRFCGQLVWKSAAEALEFAGNIYNSPFPAGNLILWADGSHTEDENVTITAASGAVAYMPCWNMSTRKEDAFWTDAKGETDAKRAWWQEDAFMLSGDGCSLDAELSAIARALGIAVHEAGNRLARSRVLQQTYAEAGQTMPHEDPKVTRIIVFTDSAYGISYIRDQRAWSNLRNRASKRRASDAQALQARRELVRLIVERSHLLAALGVERLGLHWCPSHSGVLGNILADRAARDLTKHHFNLVKLQAARALTEAHHRPRPPPAGSTPLSLLPNIRPQLSYGVSHSEWMAIVVNALQIKNNGLRGLLRNKKRIRATERRRRRSILADEGLERRARQWKEFSTRRYARAKGIPRWTD